MQTHVHHDSIEAPVLVLGWTGKTGRRVADRLAARGLPARIAFRTQRQAFDWSGTSAWRRAA